MECKIFTKWKDDCFM